MRPVRRLNPVLRALLVVVLVLAAGLVVLSFWSGTSWMSARAGDLTALANVDTDKARQRGAQLGEQAVAATEKATQKVQETISEAAVTSKIKAKMALDDSARARDVDVSTRGSIVTLDGGVRSVAEHDRVIQLARETTGVSDVVDHMCVQLWRR